jgi:(E)-4-hydroxy-3-methylbut-2-enyl-diphosphate synthase
MWVLISNCISIPDEASCGTQAYYPRGIPAPIVADIHFQYKRGIEAAEAGRLRINPGKYREMRRVKEVIKAR